MSDGIVLTAEEVIEALRFASGGEASDEAFGVLAAGCIERVPVPEHVDGGDVVARLVRAGLLRVAVTDALFMDAPKSREIKEAEHGPA